MDNVKFTCDELLKIHVSLRRSFEFYGDKERFSFSSKMSKLAEEEALIISSALEKVDLLIEDSCK